MFWSKVWELLKKIWNKLNIFKRSLNKNAGLDTVKVKLFGLEIEVTRELSLSIPYELTVVVPRAELRKNKDCNANKNNLEIILNSITIAHSPRFEGDTLKKPDLENCSPKPLPVNSIKKQNSRL